MALTGAWVEMVRVKSHIPFIVTVIVVSVTTYVLAGICLWVVNKGANRKDKHPLDEVDAEESKEEEAEEEPEPFPSGKKRRKLFSLLESLKRPCDSV